MVKPSFFSSFTLNNEVSYPPMTTGERTEPPVTSLRRDHG